MERTQTCSFIKCLECQAVGPLGYADYKAIKQWNNGSNPDALVNNRKSNHHELKEIEI